jgi:hypothetical protein
MDIGARLPRLVPKSRRRATVPWILVTASIVAGTPALSCSAALHPMQKIELMFGRAVRRGDGDAAWARFVVREITPRFPDGLTVLDAAGQWRDAAADRLVRERSKLVIIVAPADASVDARVAAVVAAYKHQFRQKSVGIVASPVCAAF